MAQDFNSPENPDVIVLPEIIITSGIDISDMPETAVALARLGLPAGGEVRYHPNRGDFTYFRRPYDENDEGTEFYDEELLDAAREKHAPRFPLRRTHPRPK
ncbi:MAG: hypothetical protein Q4G24_13315 [Paracoccus sp. (in: a-proteobacteria)]|uniref:hypothetical protein n=1 Tax=Paracoccus sp. TaxID=267 RepID=UPI0026DEA753|nr:hypothetical protein [Paracoccus sp. (in: a-proteobacteria)]MDO5622438.1 hypothetical protein [Paracoccus sp. (in: a-proteobacteria)]